MAARTATAKKKLLSTEPLIAAFDVATATGVCLGRPSDRKPFVTTWNLREAGKSRPRRLLLFSRLLDSLFKGHSVDIVRYEAPMPIAVANRIGASEDVMLLLRGAIGVLEERACAAGIEDIGSFAVQDARQHFVGRRTFRRGASGKSAAKEQVMLMCRTLGIEVGDDNSADAVAGWSYCCALANPRIAHLSSPLFA